MICSWNTKKQHNRGTTELWLRSDRRKWLSGKQRRKSRPIYVNKLHYPGCTGSCPNVPSVHWLLSSVCTWELVDYLNCPACEIQSWRLPCIVHNFLWFLLFLNLSAVCLRIKVVIYPPYWFRCWSSILLPSFICKCQGPGGHLVTTALPNLCHV